MESRPDSAVKWRNGSSQECFGSCIYVNTLATLFSTSSLYLCLWLSDIRVEEVRSLTFDPTCSTLQPKANDAQSRWSTGVSSVEQRNPNIKVLINRVLYCYYYSIKPVAESISRSCVRWPSFSWSWLISSLGKLIICWDLCPFENDAPVSTCTDSSCQTDIYPQWLAAMTIWSPTSLYISVDAVGFLFVSFF